MNQIERQLAVLLDARHSALTLAADAAKAGHMDNARFWAEKARDHNAQIRLLTQKVAA